MDIDEIKAGKQKGDKPFPHYYGDSVRRLFLIGALIMAISLPFISSFIEGYVHFSLFIIILLGLAAGLISPEQKTIIAINLLISLVAVAVFEYYAVNVYATSGAHSFFFWANQILAINFLLSLYYSSKTFRGVVLNGKD